MKMIEIQPGEKPKLVEIGDSMEAICNVVGNELQVLCFKGTGLIAYINAYGRSKNMPANGCFDVWPYQDTILHGPILVARAVELDRIAAWTDDASVCEGDMELVQRIYREVRCND